ncbi:hypothetical protein D3C76_536390 [compost metagenome]
MSRALAFAEPAVDRRRRPLRLAILVAVGARVGAGGLGRKVRAWDAQAVIATRVDHHVGLGRHVAVDALRPRRVDRMVMVRFTVVVPGLQAGEARQRRLAVMTLQAEAVTLDFYLGGMRVVTVATADPGGEHLALGERAVFIDFAVDLTIGVVEAGAQRGWQALIQLRMPRQQADAESLPPAVTEGALLHLALAAQRLVVHGKALGLTGFACLGPVDMSLARTVAALAADVLFLPGGGEAVVPVVVVFHQAGRMAVGAHAVPVLVATGPVQRVVGGKSLPGVEREPALPALRLRPAVPGDGQRLQAPAGQVDEVLLQRVVAEGVANLEVRRLAVLTLEGDEKPLPLAEKPRGNAGLVEAGIVEIAQHIGRRRIAHGPAVVGILPLQCLRGVATDTGLRCDIALGGLRL